MNRPLPKSTRTALATRPPGRTLADYLAIAVGPVLIMILVGSLIFFLIEIGYRGSFTGQIRWTLFWFTVAAVLVSRISIEQGSHYGAIYGIALGAATGLRLVQFLGAPWSALLLLGLIWWCASKLVWDCTVIDDDEDASGEGLLQTVGLEGRENTGVRIADAPPLPTPAPTGGGAPFETEPRRKPHAPGLWVLYFSLGVLPVFGVGQWTIPMADAAGRFGAFLLCVAYVLAALGLLLTSSFLGLRRYLRQRHLAMPSPMARSWIVLGSTLIAVVLLFALILPRPRGLDALAQLSWGYRERPQHASRNAWMRGEAAQGEGRRIGTSRTQERPNPSDPNGSTSNTQGRNRQAGTREATEGGDRSAGDPDQASGRSQETQDGRPGANEAPADQQASGDDGGERSGERQNAGSSGNPATPQLPPEAAGWLRAVSILAAALAVAWLLWRFGRPWWEALQKALAERRKRASTKRKSTATPERRTPAFADFNNPFRSGKAANMSPEELVRYTFEALQAWAADAGRARPPEQTPMEFGAALERFVPGVGEEVQDMIRLYVRTAYGGVAPSAESQEILQRLWAGLER